MPSYDVRLADLPSVSLAVVRRQVARRELSAAVRDGCGRAWTFARSRDLQAGRNVAVYWDGSIRLEAGVELPASFAEEEGVVGPYEHLGAAHAALQGWCAAAGRRLAGPNWEVYGHWQDHRNADPSQIRTDVFYQLAPDGVSAG